MSSSPLTATNFLIAAVVMRSIVFAITALLRPIEEDRINALPDSLTLNFDENQFPNALTFCKFVYSVLGRRDKTLPILQFNLKSHKYTNVTTFIRVAINKGIQNLTLDNPRNLPSFVLSCETLTVLNLKSVIIYSDQPVHLPSLKVLHLESVTLQNHQYLLKILCGCPILEEFETKDLPLFKTPPLRHRRQLFQAVGFVPVREGKKFRKPLWKDPDTVPECLLSHLKKCSLKIASRLGWKFRFAKYIMKNSAVLSNMTIQSAKNLDTNEKDQMFMKLSLCARKSTTCQLLFI